MFVQTAGSQIHSTSQTAGVSGDVRFRNGTDQDSCSGNREVLDLVTRCPGAKAGCEWKGELRSLEEHKSTCLYIPVPCPRECGSEEMLRQDLESHLRDDCSERDYDCPHCNETGRYRERVTSHLQDCPMVVVPCPNEGCEQEVPRSQLQAHVATDCEYAVLPCRYREHGCGAELPRGDMEAHENDYKLHLQVVAKYSQSEINKLVIVYLALQNEADELKATQIREKVTLKNSDDSITFKIAGSITFDDGMKCFTSSPFYTSPKGYAIKIVVFVDKENYITIISVQPCKGDHDNTLSWPFVGEVSVTLLNQLEDRDHHTVTINMTNEDNTRVGNFKITLTSVPTTIHHPKPVQYLAESLYIRVSVNIPTSKPWLECAV